MNQYSRIISHIVFSLQVILLFLLVFHEQVSVPVWLQTAGRFHPLILHFPISFLLLLIILLLFKKRLSAMIGFTEIYGTLLIHAVLLATLAAISGILLSTGGDYDGLLLNRHRWLGTLTAMISYAAWLVFTNVTSQKTIFNLLMVFCGVCLITGSHIGGILTHGENYLALSSSEEAKVQKKPVTDSSPVFEAAIQPVLEAKCYSCHNEKKAKGKLVMSSMEAFLKGGKEGPAFKAGDPENSLLIKRILLDPSDKKHMPPKGKTPLSEAEILLIHQWIGRGASFDKSFRDFPEQDSFRIMASSFIIPDNDPLPGAVSYPFPPADEKLLTKLNNPYRRITETYKRSPALQLNFYISGQYKPSMLEECIALKQQIVSINLSNMPVEDEALKTIAQFENLEELFLNGTNITGSTLAELQSCKNLARLSLANTKVAAKHLDILGKSSLLKKVFLWQTGVTGKEIDYLEQKFPQIHWDPGYLPDSAERLKLTPPQMLHPEKMIFASTESFALKHPLPGVEIRFTMDGSEPDSSSSQVYRQPILIKGPTVIKARAFMPGWYGSDIKEWMVFATGLKPSSAVLLSPPDPKYVLQGGSSLIDGQKGESNNLMVHWLGFRMNPFKAGFTFNNPAQVSRIILSMADNVGSYIFPPVSIIVRGGPDSINLTTIGKLVPVQPSKYSPSRNQAYMVPVMKGNYRYIQVEAMPVPSLPLWHSGKKDKGWIFIDEVFFD